MSENVSMMLNRRDFVRASVAVPAAGALYFGYSRVGHPVKAGIVGTGNEGCQAMIAQSPPGYLEYVAYHDIRPSQIARGRKALVDLYGAADGRRVKFHDRYDDMIADPDIEAIVIATPLWTHADLAIRAMRAGKHVLCEKLMAHNIGDAKKMVRTAAETGRILSIGHQRHYSTLYADALETIRNGDLGQVKHLQAMWHRNNAQLRRFDEETNKPVHRDSWYPNIPKEDREIDFAAFGYESLEELVRWRLYNRTGGGLMAELGSHQLDACSIFLKELLGAERHVQPKAVSGIGGMYFYDDERECFDHIYCTYEFPGDVTMTYSSINTNGIEGYGEIVSGTRGTLMVMQERDVLYYPESDPSKSKRERWEAEQKRKRYAAMDVGDGPRKPTTMTTQAAGEGDSTMYSAASLGVTVEAENKGGADVSRGYREELEHFAYCIRNPDPDNQPRCDGPVALADAVMALTANIAMRTGRRIEFQDDWFDADAEGAPEDELRKA